MVHVPHDGNDRCARLKRCGRRLFEEDLLGCRGRSLRCLCRGLLHLFWFWLCHIESKLCCNQRGCFAINSLVHGGENPTADQGVDDVGRVDPEDLCEFADSH